MPDDSNDGFATIGKILAPHGLDGTVKVYPYTDFPERCHDLDEVTVALGRERRRMHVERASVFGRFWLIGLAGIGDRDAAGRLRDGLLQIPLSSRVPLPDGYYYFDQLVGLEVFTSAGELLGRITGVIATGGHDLYVLQPDGLPVKEKEILLPAVKEFIKEIDPGRGRMVVDPPEGLLDL